MSTKTIELIQRLQQETPSIADKLGDFLLQTFGERVDFMCVYFVKTDDGTQVLASSAGQLSDDVALQAPELLMIALTDRSGSRRIRAYPDNKDKH